MALEIYKIFVSLLLFSLNFQTLVVQSRNLKTSKKKSVDYLNNFVGAQNGHSITGLRYVKNYLNTYGYYDPDQNINFNNDDFDDHLQFAIEEYQKFFNINVTGTLDYDTIKQMTMPRCGEADIIHSRKNSTKFHNESSRYEPNYSFVNGRYPSWKTNLTYRLGSVSAGIDVQSTISVLAGSFQKWADVSHFKFEGAPIGSAHDIMIGFYTWEHGDSFPFDGPGRVIAHALVNRGKPVQLIHFDDDESWSTLPSSSELDLETVSLHEIGHVLGLGHTKDYNAVMYPIIKTGEIVRVLGKDDIDGIHTLYDY